MIFPSYFTHKTLSINIKAILILLNYVSFSMALPMVFVFSSRIITYFILK